MTHLSLLSRDSGSCAAKHAVGSLVSYPDPALCEGKGLVTIERTNYNYESCLATLTPGDPRDGPVYVEVDLPTNNTSDSVISTEPHYQTPFHSTIITSHNVAYQGCTFNS